MKVFIAATFATCFLFLSGCNTMEGAGKDVEAGGKKVANPERVSRSVVRLVYAVKASRFKIRPAVGQCLAREDGKLSIRAIGR